MSFPCSRRREQLELIVLDEGMRKATLASHERKPSLQVKEAALRKKLAGFTVKRYECSLRYKVRLVVVVLLSRTSSCCAIAGCRVRSVQNSEQVHRQLSPAAASQRRSTSDESILHRTIASNSGQEQRTRNRFVSFLTFSSAFS